jgi:hypothetical protein
VNPVCITCYPSIILTFNYLDNSSLSRLPVQSLNIHIYIPVLLLECLLQEERSSVKEFEYLSSRLENVEVSLVERICGHRSGGSVDVGRGLLWVVWML